MVVEGSTGPAAEAFGVINSGYTFRVIVIVLARAATLYSATFL